VKKRVEINVTRKCNKKCRFCYIKRKNINIKRSVLRKVIKKYQPEEVILTGGEPLLHPEIFEIIQDIKNQKIQNIALFTNCLTLNKKIINRLKKLKVRIQASYPQHNLKTLIKLKALKRKKFNILSSTILLRKTFKKIDLILRDLSLCDVNVFLFPIPLNRNSMANLISGEEWHYMTEALLEKAKKYGNNLYYELAYVKGSTVPKVLGCSAGREDVMFIDSDGERIPCCLMSDIKYSKKRVKHFNLVTGECAALKMVYKKDPRVKSEKYLPVCPLLLVDKKRQKFSETKFAEKYFIKWKEKYIREGLKEIN